MVWMCIGRAACKYLAGSAIGAWLGGGIGIAAFGTATGMVPGRNPRIMASLPL